MSYRDADSADGGDPPFERGHVVWVERTTSVESRPFLVLSDGIQPEREYVGVPLSTTEQEDAVRIGPSDWKTGGPDESSFAIAWRLRSFPHEAITHGIGALEEDVVNEIAQVASGYFEPAK